MTLNNSNTMRSPTQIQTRPLHTLKARFIALLMWLALAVFGITAITGVSNRAQAQVPDFSGVQNKDAKKFLPAAMAFQFSGSATAPQQYTLTWRVAPNYYLYKERMKISATNGATVTSIKWLSAAESKNDPNFGVVQVFHNQARAVVTVNTSKVTGTSAKLNVQYQGCADGGLCYPPMNASVAMAVTPAPNAAQDATATAAAATNATAAAVNPDNAVVSPNNAVVNANENANVNNGNTANANAANSNTNTPNTNNINEASGLAQFLTTASLPVLLGTLLLLGMGLAFTPCVFPMMPILTSLIAGESAKNLTPMRGFKLSLAYVLGMALVYAALGSIMGALGARANVAVWLQKPAVIIASSALFIMLALSMFGLFTLQLPSGLQNRLNNLSNQQKGGRFTGAFVMGAISALVVSPCVSAPLVGVLGFISTTGKAATGALALFALAFGMGIPLIVLGTTGGKFLPKAGAWMDAVKGFFGVGLLAVAIGLLARILPESLVMVLWSVLCAGSAVFLGAFAQAQTGMQKIAKTLGLLLFVYAMALLVGALSGQTDPLKPLAFGKSATVTTGAVAGTSASSSAGVPFKTIHTIDALNAEMAAAKAAGKPVVVDLAADWCASCKVMERTTFMDAQVVSRLSAYSALRLDITDTNDAHNAWMQRLGIFGPPVVLFYDAQGNEVNAQRVVGEANAAEFLAKIPK